MGSPDAENGGKVPGWGCNGRLGLVLEAGERHADVNRRSELQANTWFRFFFGGERRPDLRVWARAALLLPGDVDSRFTDKPADPFRLESVNDYWKVTKLDW